MQTLGETLQTKKLGYPTMVNNSFSTSNNYSYNNSSFSRVNRLLERHTTLIHQAYVGWFARRFHKLPDAAIENAAELACTARDSQRYFAKVINAEYQKSACN